MRRNKPKRGWGRCQECDRIIGSTAKRCACRHGHFAGGLPCGGSGRALLDWQDRAKWEGRPLRLVLTL